MRSTLSSQQSPLGGGGPNDLLSAKEVGEPPLVLAITAYFAVKRALLASRKERGHDEWFRMDAPATVEAVRKGALIDRSELTVV